MRSGIPDELKVMLKLLCNGLQSPTKVSSSLPPAPPPACPSPPASTAFPALAPWLRYLSAEHQDLILQLYLIFKIPGNGICLPGSLAAFCWEDSSRAVEMWRLANKFVLSTWWFIPLPYKVQVGTGEGSVMKELNTAGVVVAFLKLSESDYMFATSQVKSGVVIS